MSTILDALKKASEERGHVRSPIAQGDLFAQTRPTQSRPARSGGSFPRLTHIAFAFGMFMLIAAVSIAIVLRASNTADQGEVATGPVASPAPQPAVTPPTPPAPQTPPPTVVAAAVPTVTPGDLAPPRQAQPPASRIDRYLQQGGSAPVPIPLQIETLPPPDPLADDLLDELERDWDSELDDAEIAPPAPRQPDFRLEGIVYDENNPMAIVNGAIVCPGDSVGGAQVVAISIESVTLSVQGEEVILSH